MSIGDFDMLHRPKRDYEYITAHDLDRAWLNFELDLPLCPGPAGEPNPFYVDRPGNPVGQLEDALLAPFWSPPKFFFSGHRGCGKSTELLRLAANPQIRAKYWPVHFSIRDMADIYDLDFRDVLLAIGTQMYQDYRDKGGRLPQQLLKELDAWRGKIETEVQIIEQGRVSDLELEAGLDAFFGNAGLKMKLEPATRQTLRQVFERNITELIGIINLVATTIQSQEERLPLILIDDLDKPDLESAREIFHGRREVMLQPTCAIVYTVSSALFYSQGFDAIRDRAVFLPNVKLHPHRDDTARDREGYNTLRLFVYKRLARDLITEEALNAAISHSGGVFRELVRIVRTAISRARRRDTAKDRRIEIQDVRWAVTEIRNEYRRILDQEDLDFLRDVHQHQKMVNHGRLRPLLQLLALLEYRNAENWCDVHPAIIDLLDESSV
jgi:hypothetical protein